MFTHRINDKSNERGALMIEAIALLGLMTMMSPMIVRQTADRTSEMEEVAIAGQMKEIKDALSNWIEANYQEKAKEIAASSEPSDSSFQVEAKELAPYLSATYLDGENFRGNKLVDDFEVGVRAQCTEARKNDCVSTSSNDCSCGTMSNGTVTGLGGTCACTRYKMTGVVLSKSENPIDDRRASRIASMIGADGGYMRTKRLVESLYGPGSTGGSGESGSDTNTPEMQKILGAQGIWEGKLSDYLGDSAVESEGGRVAATTIYSSGFSGDYLYRKKVDGLPGANSMFTDLDMGGATNCEGDGCYKINNAGGLEVIDGKILIRTRNTENDDEIGNPGDTSYAMIALGTDKSHIQTNEEVRLSVGDTENPTSLLNLTASEAELSLPDAGYIAISNTATEKGVQVGALNVNINADDDLFVGGSNIQIEADNDLVQMATNLYANMSDSIYLNGNNLIALNSFETVIEGNYVDVNVSEDVDIYANNAAFIEAMYTNLRAGSSLVVGMNSANSPGLSMTSSRYQLQSNSTSINGTDGQIELTAGASSTSATYPGQQTFSNTTNFVINNSTLRGRILDNKSSFALTANNFAVDVLNNTSNTPTRMLVNNTGLVVQLNANASPHTIAYLASVYSNRAKLSVNGDTGYTSGSTSAGTNALVTIANHADGGIAPYNTHGGDTQYAHFRVDPSYMSVMNDIKITSRGGARLSEALPNYILKGIYELTNSYGSGPWPCGNGNCDFTMPYYSLNDLGLKSGGWEFNCGANGATSHPIVAGGGSCTSSSTYVKFSYYKAAYKECSDGSFCWAHPYMGAVPAPGRAVSNEGAVISSGFSSSTKGLAAYDEGPCPDGYQAVMTLTPTVFELGKVNMISPDKRPYNATVTYNPGWQNYANSDIANVTGLVQPATKLGLIVQPITSGSSVYGWKIAMGTVTPVSSDINTEGYIWNAGGITANSWSAIAHTYCYFNPDRFTMPNMVINGTMIQTATNPNL